ncbi:unnamed protein product [Clavelina lepadiformis]|uniref:Uncharacterized protein n=1 Tax=Clavelina lepadiformis TaxID=159417 RepID=A0ABP0GW17_CLALP
MCRLETVDSENVSGDFSQNKLDVTLQKTEPGKAPGPDNIYSDHIHHAGPIMKSSLRFPVCDSTKIWKRALVVAIPKSLGDSKSYLFFVSPSRRLIVYAYVET